MPRNRSLALFMMTAVAGVATPPAQALASVNQLTEARAAVRAISETALNDMRSFYEIQTAQGVLSQLDRGIVRSTVRRLKIRFADLCDSVEARADASMSMNTPFICVSDLKLAEFPPEIVPTLFSSLLIREAARALSLSDAEAVSLQSLSRGTL